MIHRPSRFIVVFSAYYYLSSNVSLFQISNSLREFAQAVAPVDDRFYLSGLHKIAHDGQVLFVRSRQKCDELLAYESRQYKRCDQTGHNTDHAPTGQLSDHDAYPRRI
jgi:hypothetical protein